MENMPTSKLVSGIYFSLNVYICYELIICNTFTQNTRLAFCKTSGPPEGFLEE